MTRTQQSSVPHANRATLGAIIGALIASSAAAQQPEKTSRRRQQRLTENAAYAQIAALEPAVAYLADKRQEPVSDVLAFKAKLADIVNGNVSAREKVGIAKIYDAHVRVANFSDKGTDGITDENFRVSLTMQIANDGSRTRESWATDPVVIERFEELQAACRTYLESVQLQ